jgi:plasmid rolling circle replication initiator protein Rep
MKDSQPSEGDSFYLSELSSRDKPWDTHRASADEIQNLYKLTQYDRYSERIDACSKWLDFALKASDEGELKLKLKKAKFCRVRHCPVCQWRRSLMWRARFFQALPEVQKNYPTGRWIFLTLTVRNCPLSELKKTLTWMNKGWKRLTERKDFPALGWVKSVEVTRNPDDGSAHPHFHCLMLVPSRYFKNGYISQAKWRELWQACLKTEYLPVVNVKSVKGNSAKSNGNLNDASEVAKAVCETLKYSVKESDLLADPDWLIELTKQLHKTRAIALGGVLKEYLSEDDPEDLINTEEENDDESLDESDSSLIFDWADNVRRYKKRKEASNS